jgi:exodeoxyribonuclease X
MIIVLDTETTGLAPPEAEVIELATIRLCRDEFLAGSDSCLIPPARPIPPEASAVHHLTYTLEEAWKHCVSDWAEPVPGVGAGESIEAFAAHNAEYDKQFLMHLSKDTPWLCTYRCARHLFPDAPGFGNQVLRYYLGLKPEFPPGLYPHRALYDTIVTADILQEMLKLKSLAELLGLQHKPVLMQKINFGKHRGKLFKEAPKDYLAWLIKQDFDGDTLHTAKHWLNGGSK